MSNNVPVKPKIFHILHIDKLESVINNTALLCDSDKNKMNKIGSTIGMDKIKRRRLNQLTLNSHPNLYVGDCVPFYFCPRSVMLYMFNKNNHPEIDYHGGQEPIIHLKADLFRVVDWADKNSKRWAFTLTNAGAFYFEDRNDLSKLKELNWNAINTNNWKDCRDEKQAEFLLEKSFPWELIESIGVYSSHYYQKVTSLLLYSEHKPSVYVKRDWYY